ncbi:MAG: hypothetical protein PGN37_13455 [Mycobacterium kyogaense]|uniref:hypothetical protein n=1 Tax=Mycobacterium kyogaense TaxID=2212479 RepID=UPI002FF6F84F
MRLILTTAVAIAAVSVAAAPTATAQDLWFTSPSGPIACMHVDDLLRCDITQRD